ncbi:glycerophosphodiester phosphodiesterase [Sideroxydans lithotrophicus]|uniref:Glycerophosphoryl diester phosphodiesterase n=1 Tax=Sideroxydans lithotrophicus (strain ES-1) TaxID=580332 RepID=D5CML3_SIDLE|nr:glycerophosphodiester phosphodiesterase [Sideroxydans lithotrophicus]ADE12685.1 glycerophosphoryl diester phosphodiesterase [Sideroxydans lithotrophicus ES-1]
MNRTMIFAHRGANQEAAENTRSAFDKALAYPIDGIETDVQLSRDEVPVLWHDRYLKKLKLPGNHIDDFDYAQLQTMDFAAHFPGAAKEGVMSLQEFIAAYRPRCRLLLEIKNRDWEMLSRQELKVRKTLELAGPVTDGRIMVSSFDLGSLVYASRLTPRFPLVLNLEPEHTLNDARRALDDQPFLYGLCVHISTLDADMMKLVRERGKRIAVYTCNTDAEIGRALTLGVDVLISDVPQKALQMRDR